MLCGAVQAEDDAGDDEAGWETASDSSEDTSMAAATEATSTHARAGSSVHSGESSLTPNCARLHSQLLLLCVPVC